MPTPPKAGESQRAFIARCMRYLVKEGKSRDQAAGQCYGMWDHQRKVSRIAKRVIGGKGK